MDDIAPEDRRLTLVVAAYNEAEALPALQRRIESALGEVEAAGLEARVLYVDDGSRDGTFAVLQRLAADDPRVGVLRLSRNFGKERALTAGLDHADADAVVVLDADGQDPPELIPQFVAKWREGYDMVYGTRAVRDGETWLKKLTALGFYRVMARMSSTPIPRDTGDFRLMSRGGL